MGDLASAADWAEQEFGAVDLRDRRRTRRLVAAARTLATRPSGSLPQRLDWNELRGFYRLVHGDRATPGRLLAGHFAATRDRMRQPEPVLIVHDTTELDFTGHEVLAARLGPMGRGAGRGLLQHTSLAVAPRRGELLGLAFQQLCQRTAAPAGETRLQRQRRAGKESRLWLAGFRGVGPAPAGACWVDVCDRGGDFFAALWASRQLGHHFLVRLYQDRCVTPAEAAEPAEAETEHLLGVARGLAAVRERTVAIASRGGRPRREARVLVGYGRVTVRPPRHDPQSRQWQPVEMTVIRVWEVDPPEGTEAVEWILGTSLAAAGPDEVLEYVDWYAWRWRTAEEYHKVQKTGLGAEDLRFETPHPLRAALAILAVVAVRVLGLRWARDGQGDEPAGAVATAEEVEVVQKATRAKSPPATIRAFVDGVARLGGYLGRKGDGPPGWQSLWRGYQRLADMLLGIELARSPPRTRPD